MPLGKAEIVRVNGELWQTMLTEQEIGEWRTYVCCDCGLSHDVVVKRDINDKEKVFLRWFRNNRSTGQQRRHYEFARK